MKFSEIKLSKSFFIIFAIVQILIIIYFAFNIFDEKMARISEIEKVKKLVEIAKYQNNLIHNLQKERGQSVGFISSKGTNKENIYIKLTEESKIFSEQLLSQYNKLNLKSFHQSVRSSIEKNKECIKRIENLRTKILNFEISTKEARIEYHKIIRTFLQHLLVLRELSTFDKELYDNVIDIYNLEEIAESIGKTRALYIDILTTNIMTTESLNEAAVSFSEREIFWRQFIYAGTLYTTDLYIKTVVGPDVDSTNEIIKKSYMNIGQPINISPQKCYRHFTGYLELIFKVEDEVNQKTKEYSEQLISDIEFELNIYKIVTGMAILITLFVTYYFNNKINN